MEFPESAQRVTKEGRRSQFTATLEGSASPSLSDFEGALLFLDPHAASSSHLHTAPCRSGTSAGPGAPAADGPAPASSAAPWHSRTAML